MVDVSRTIILKDIPEKKGPVVYWMSRDVRVSDNWALLFAAQKSVEMKQPLWVVFTLASSFGEANLRHYHFLIEGLREVERNLLEIGANFILLMGEPQSSISEFISELNAGILVSDFDPLRIKQNWKSLINKNLKIRHVEVDAHNIVPCRVASNKLEFGAYTLRPKINRLIKNYLTEFPPLPSLYNKPSSISTDWDQAFNWLKPKSDANTVNWITPGEGSAKKTLNDFLQKRLTGYAENRNNPLIEGQSNLSPYLHFGNISAQRIAIEVSKKPSSQSDKLAFLEELIIRRELSDNFCFYNSNYDNINGIHSWAKETLLKHKNDEREFEYTPNSFENALTHDHLWNAAQKQMIKTGKMHGYLRMYWAKKILEWTKSPEEAMEIAITLNDKYSIDGRDPNGYAGVAWSIGGVHDRAWSERPVFGKIRYMNYNGCKRKFDVDGYIKMINNL